MFFASEAMAASSLGRQELADMAANLLNNLGGANGPFLTFFVAFCLLMGVILVITGIWHLTKRETPKGGAIATILIGILLISVDQTLRLFSMTLFDQAADMSLMAEKTSGSSPLSTAAQTFVNLALFMVQVVGYLAVYRGLKTLSDVSLTHQRQPEQTKSAIVFIVAGVLCINILWTLQMVCGTLGGEAQAYYNRIFGHLG